MTKLIFKRIIATILLLFCLLMGYMVIEITDTKKLIKITQAHQLDASFYIRHFGNLDNTKTKQALTKQGKSTLTILKNAQTKINQTTLYTPFAIKVRNDYNKGVLQLENALKISNENQNLQSDKQQIAKAKQTLLNAREKLFNLAGRYLLSIELKM